MKKNRYWLVWLIIPLFFSCAYWDVEKVPIAYGVKGHVEPVQFFFRQPVKKALDIIVDVTSKRWGRDAVIKTLGSLTIYLCDPTDVDVLKSTKKLETVCRGFTPSDYTNGYYNPGQRRSQFSFKPLLSASAMGHEVLHHLVYFLDGKSDMHVNHREADGTVIYFKKEHLDMDLEITRRMIAAGL